MSERSQLSCWASCTVHTGPLQQTSLDPPEPGATLGNGSMPCKSPYPADCRHAGVKRLHTCVLVLASSLKSELPDILKTSTAALFGDDARYNPHTEDRVTSCGLG